MDLCHVCNNSLIEIPRFGDLIQVTSDCRTWRRGGRLCICRYCGTVQKPVTEYWLRETEEIYSDYKIYGQSGGVEQSSFDPTNGASMARSQKIVSWLSQVGLPKKGNLLDIGCGNGAFLRAFSPENPGWQLTGLELDDRNQEVIGSIPGVKKLHVGPIEGFNECFDLIVLIHALEHIPDPVNYLKSCSKKLNLEGRILIEVPNHEKSPFDILIADHCTHFSSETLRTVVTAAGFDLIETLTDFVPKELTLLAHWQDKHDFDIKEPENTQKGKESFETGKTIVKTTLGWLEDLIYQGQNETSDVGIFGTSISATWLTASLRDKVTFFVDEDSNRVGRTHMRRPIYSPRNAPDDYPILMPFTRDVAESINFRYEDIKLILPPNQVFPA